jgi:hypothetical protein
MQYKPHRIQTPPAPVKSIRPDNPSIYIKTIEFSGLSALLKHRYLFVTIMRDAAQVAHCIRLRPSPPHRCCARLANDVINLISWCYTLKSAKTIGTLTQAVIARQDNQSKFAPFGVIAPSCAAALGHVLPSLTRMVGAPARAVTT